METALVPTPGPADTRQRLIDVAVDLFTRHSFAGTSLQMIADEMGFTKAAIYYHFRTREELLGAVVEPIFDQLSDIITTAEAQRGANARADYMLRGYAELAVANRALVSMLACDPSVTTLLRDQPQWADLINRQLALLAGADPDPAGLIKATVALAGNLECRRTGMDRRRRRRPAAPSRRHRTTHPWAAQPTPPDSTSVKGNRS